MGPSCSKHSAVFAECRVEKYGMTLEVTESMLGWWKSSSVQGSRCIQSSLKTCRLKRSEALGVGEGRRGLCSKITRKDPYPKDFSLQFVHTAWNWCWEMNFFSGSLCLQAPTYKVLLFRGRIKTQSCYQCPTLACVHSENPLLAVCHLQGLRKWEFRWSQAVERGYFWSAEHCWK